MENTMQSIQVGQLKSDFSNILQMVQQEGETFIVEYGKSHKKVAMIIPYDPALDKKEDRVFGQYKNRGNVIFKDDFEMSEEELLGL